MPRLNLGGMSRDDAEEYTQSLGQIVGGSWRQIHLAQRLGVPEALGMSTEEWVRERLGGYVRLAIPERREAVKELTADGLSQRKIGEVLGVDESQIRRDVRAANAAPDDDKSNDATPPQAEGAANAALVAASNDNGKPPPDPTPARESDPAAIEREALRERCWTMAKLVSDAVASLETFGAHGTEDFLLEHRGAVAFRHPLDQMVRPLSPDQIARMQRGFEVVMSFIEENLSCQ